MDVHFRLDPNRLTLNDQIAAEEASTLTARQLRELLAHHVTDENGVFLEAEVAEKLIGSLTITQQREALSAFSAAIQEASNKMLPLASGGK